MGIWNRFILESEDEHDTLSQNVLSEWGKGDEGNIFDFNSVFSTTTDSNNEIKRRCMILFGQTLCLCEFVNGMADPDGLKPLYECDAAPFLSSKSKTKSNTNEKDKGQSDSESESESESKEVKSKDNVKQNVKQQQQPKQEDNDESDSDDEEEESP